MLPSARIGILVAACLVYAPTVRAQSYPVYQTGTTSRGHMTMWTDNAHVGDAGGALNGKIHGLGVTPLHPNQPVAPFCINDTFISNPAGYHEICVRSDALDGGGELTYTAFGAANNPFTMQSSNKLVVTSGNQQVAMQNLPQTVAGDVPVCISPATGQLFQASSVDRTILLTDDANSKYLTDNSGSTYLTATIPAGSCIQQ